MITKLGQLKSKVTVHCALCGCSHRRNLKIDIYENTSEAIENAKIELMAKAKKEYTCRICKTITRDINAN